MENGSVEQDGKKYLLAIAEGFERAKRYGTSVDTPEGTRYIIVSDTLATEITEFIRRYFNA